MAHQKKDLEVQTRKIEMEGVETNNQLYPPNMRDYKTTDEYLYDQERKKKVYYNEVL